METPTPQNKEADGYVLASTFTPLSDKAVRAMTRRYKQFVEKEELKHRNFLISQMIQTMSAAGASDRAIRKALPGLDEYAKYANGFFQLNRESRKPENPETEDIDLTPVLGEEIPGLFLSQIKTREVRWLWENRIPLGKITILDGDPGIGKSLLAINVAARVSTGHPMPDGTPGKQGGVILISFEDGAGDTLRPRLEAAGGDPSHIFLLNTFDDLDTKKMKAIDRPFSLSRDLEILEEAIKRIKAVLVILDPLMAVIGRNIDSSRDQDVREVFIPLAQLAERTGCAVLIIRHLNKGASKNALYRGAGSIGIIGAARTGLLIAQHPYEEHKRILATTKNNLSQKASNLSFQVVENESGIPYIQWLEENNFTLPTLLDRATNISLERHKILQALRAADGSLGPQEVAELTGQNDASVRLTLSRMHKAGEITRLYRGKYTTLDHPSLRQERMDSSANISATSDTSDTLDTSDTTATLNTINTPVPDLVSVNA